MTTPARADTWWRRACRELRMRRTDRGRPAHEKSARRAAIRERFALGRSDSVPTNGELHITGTATAVSSPLTAGRRTELTGLGYELRDRHADVLAAEAQLRTAEEDVAQAEKEFDKAVIREAETSEPAFVEPASGETQQEFVAPEESQRTLVQWYERLQPPELMDVDETEREKRKWARKLQARTFETVMLLFDWLFYFSSYLRITGKSLSFGNAEQLLFVFGAVLLGIVGPPIVLISARLVARQLARWRDGMLNESERERPNWYLAWISVGCLLVTVFVLFMVMRMRLQLAVAEGQTLPSNTWVLQLLVALLPVAVLLTDYYAETPRADHARDVERKLQAALDAEEADRARAEAKAAAAHVPPEPTLEEQLRTARATVRDGRGALADAQRKRALAWTKLYQAIAFVLGEQDYFASLAQNLIHDERAFVATELARQGQRGPDSGPIPAGSLPTSQWKALDAISFELVVCADDDQHRKEAAALRDHLRMKAGKLYR